jgi:hypothetical protein
MDESGDVSAENVDDEHHGFARTVVNTIVRTTKGTEMSNVIANIF